MKKHLSYKNKRTLFAFNVIFLFLVSLSVLIMPYSTNDGSGNAVKILTSLMFWIGLLGTIIFAALINFFRRKDVAFSKVAEKHKRFALTHFFQNMYATVFDVLLISSIIGLILSTVFNILLFGRFIFISVIILSFGMHCLLNGTNYIYVRNKKIRRVKKHE